MIYKSSKIAKAIGFLVASLTICTTSAFAHEDKLDMPAKTPVSNYVFINGEIWTADDKNPTAEAVVVKGDNIVFVGKKKDALKLQNKDSVIVDLKGKMLAPGFYDTHTHPDWLGANIALKCDVSGRNSIPRIEEKIKECTSELGEDQWLIGAGWALGAFPDSAPSKELLDKLTGDKPALLIAEDGHTAWANSKALEIANVTADTKDPLNGEIVRVKGSNEPQGTLREYAQMLITPFTPTYDSVDGLVAYKAFMKRANSKGITSVIDAWGTYGNLERLRFLESQKELTLRYTMAMFINPEWDENWDKITKAYDTESEFLKVDQIKFWMDGVAEAQTAALTFKYEGSDKKGELFFTDEQLFKWVPKLEALGYKIHMHTIGDAAVKQGLRTLEHSRAVNKKANNHPYFIHNYVVDKADFPRFVAAGASANFTMLWRQNNDSMVYLNKPVFTKEVYEQLMPMAEMEEAGINVIGGSDSPVGQINPLASIEVGVTGKVVPYFENGDFDATQPVWAGKPVKLESMLKAYTINAATAAGTEDIIGSITVGKKADLIIIEKDLFKISPDDIYETEVEMTMVGGNIVFEKS